ncbi:hypothetical protein ACROYT_G035731 [Oculina patagonica]
MAAAPDPEEVLRSTSGKANFQRVTRLLISGGTTLLREIFDQLCPPSYLPTKLKDPTTEKQLKAARLTSPQWVSLYPSPGDYGKSIEFDVTLLFKLLRTICSLSPPVTGWDALPTSTDHTLTADLARIKYYRNSVYGHVNQNMDITDDEFKSLWQEIRDTLVRVAGHISHTKKTEWQGAIDKFLKDPLTAEDEKNVKELLSWYRNDMEVKEKVEELKNITQKGIERLEEKGQEVKAHLGEQLNAATQVVREGIERLGTSLEEKGQNLEMAVRGESQEIKAGLGEQLHTTQEVQEGMQRLETSLEEKGQNLEMVVREESQEIKARLEEQLNRTTQDMQEGMERLEGAQTRLEGKLEEVHQSIAKLSTQAEGFRIPPALLQLKIDCPTVSGPGQQGGSSERKAEASTDVGNDGLPTPQDVLRLAALKAFQVIHPSKQEELNCFVEYLEKVRKALIVDTHQGSLIITLECSSLEILDELWEDYCTGHLNEMAQKYLVTEDLLKELGLTDVKLSTTILEEDYRACREHLLHFSALLQVRIDCPAVSGPGPTAQDVLNLAASKYLQAIDPSKPEDLNGFIYYLEKVRKVLILDARPGSLIITLECNSLEILDELWEDYCTGHLNEMAQKYLVTEDLLKELGLTDVKLSTTILEEDYRACREHLLQYSDRFLQLTNKIPEVQDTKPEETHQGPTSGDRDKYVM